MITISILGLDPFISEHYSADIHKKAAKLFGCSVEDIIVHAQESFLYHNGVDQTSWHTIIHVHAPSKYRSVAPQVAAYLLQALKGHIVHGAVEFYYFDESDRYESFDDTYPRYVTSANEVEPVVAASEEQQVYLGDAFKGVKLDQKGSQDPKVKK